jgi:DNA-binding MarR family transcriptional regulator
MQQLTRQKPSPAVQAFTQLLQAHAGLTRELSAELSTEHGLTINDYEVLLRLARAPERRMRRVDLAGEVLLSPSGITRMLDRLEAAGLVARGACATDARVSYAVLTDGGLAKLRKASRDHVAGIDRALGNQLSDEELRTLVELLRRLPAPDEDEACEPPEDSV